MVELHRMTTNDIEDRDSVLVVMHVPEAKTKKKIKFTNINHNTGIIKMGVLTPTQLHYYALWGSVQGR